MLKLLTGWSALSGHVSWDEYKVKFLATKGHNEREVAEKIKTSKGNITFLFVIENRDEKMVDFGIKTADEIRFVANRSFEDYAAVSKNKLKPTYTEENK